jgi:hypothetical protein
MLLIAIALSLVAMSSNDTPKIDLVDFALKLVVFLVGMFLGESMYNEYWKGRR